MQPDNPAKKAEKDLDMSLFRRCLCGPKSCVLFCGSALPSAPLLAWPHGFLLSPLFTYPCYPTYSRRPCCRQQGSPILSFCRLPGAPPLNSSPSWDNSLGATVHLPNSLVFVVVVKTSLNYAALAGRELTVYASLLVNINAAPGRCPLSSDPGDRR